MNWQTIYNCLTAFSTLERFSFDPNEPNLARADAVEDEAKDSIWQTSSEQLTDSKGKFGETEGVCETSIPRTNSQVTRAGVTMTPELGLNPRPHS